jgi:hypothetical protein
MKPRADADDLLLDTEAATFLPSQVRKQATPVDHMAPFFSYSSFQ